MQGLIILLGQVSGGRRNGNFDALFSELLHPSDKEAPYFIEKLF